MKILQKIRQQIMKDNLSNKDIFPNLTEPLRILIVTDTHGHASTSFGTFVEQVGDIDVVFTLGDVEHRDFEIINKCKKMSGVPKYGILGNHDSFSVLKENGIKSIHGEVIEVNGIKFLGMYGSIKYKNTNTPMLTDEESLQIATLLPECDVFLTHDRSKNTETKNFSHSGLAGITEYLKTKKPTLHMHGHLHENMTENIFGIPSYGFARYAYLEINKSGINIIKSS